MLEPLTKMQILNYIPQTAPFRFIDQINWVDQTKISGSYTFKPDEFFYAGHFPGKPITPGVILLETMCQTGVVAFGIYLLSTIVPATEISQWITMFTDAQVEFFRSVYPGDQVTIIGEKKFWRKMKLNSKIDMYDHNNNLLATAIAAGVGIKK